MEIVHFGGDKYGVKYGAYFVSHNTMRIYNKPKDVKFYCVMSKEEAEITLNILRNTKNER